ncbi:hypothetical protein Q4555_05910 [Octadecabacter sp. 1_MG-2023]|uniref:hypothetical protein n=1 Tax=unclassified Octadecabacter TaxID=196158 RepID=UPI001C0950E1|nr:MULTISPECIES: hypothetical protein [unclassified Octadecabacter]MBU2994513.1 hypothetical protein [Octadecabacter sp. B2R22]MDO6734194.1 hypothetical protein [Octadecabacter sp. 1_MG-2023]
MPPKGDDGPLGWAVSRDTVKTGLTMCASVCAAVLVLPFIPPVPAAVASDIRFEEMTYQGMTLNEFADKLHLSADDPYLVGLFEDLCRREGLMPMA